MKSSVYSRCFIEQLNYLQIRYTLNPLRILSPCLKVAKKDSGWIKRRELPEHHGFMATTHTGNFYFTWCSGRYTEMNAKLSFQVKHRCMKRGHNKSTSFCHVVHCVCSIIILSV